MGLNKLNLVLLLALIGGSFSRIITAGKAIGEDRALELATTCNNETCLSPDCRCSVTYLNDDIPISQIPQLVMLTFDDAVTVENSEYYEDAFYGLTNPDGCPVAATFFVSHEYTDYSKVHTHWANGHEIALHSISHSPLQSYWAALNYDGFVSEFGGQRELVANFAKIPIEDITGMRVPLFQLAGNSSFEALSSVGLTYDSSWPSQHFIEPGMWPYTLDYASTQDCTLGGCPNASLPGVWINPLLNWIDLEGYACSMVDACSFAPEEEDDIFEWLVWNFERSYNGNRSPFGVYMHAAWFGKNEHNFPAYKRFLTYMNNLEDVFMVSTQRVIEYTRNPRPLSDGPFESCQTLSMPACAPKLCQLVKQTTLEERWMTQCGDCPAVYPWVDNPLGL